MKINHIRLSEGATTAVVNAAVNGYEASYKEERLGFLLGTLSRGIVQVEQAVVYRGGTRTRTAAYINPNKFERRAKLLQEQFGLDYLGSFHTHNEVARTISSTLSQADKTPLCNDPPSFIEIIAAIWVSDDNPRQSNLYLQGKCGDYRFRLAGYGCQQNFRCLPVSSIIAR